MSWHIEKVPFFNIQPLNLNFIWKYCQRNKRFYFNLIFAVVQDGLYFNDRQLLPVLLLQGCSLWRTSESSSSTQLQRSCCCCLMTGSEKPPRICSEVKVFCLRVRVWMLLATLHVTAVDPKVTDHPSCVFTHFIISQLCDQQCFNCSWGPNVCLADDTQVFGLLTSDVLFLALDAPFTAAGVFWVPFVGPDVLSHVWRRPPAGLLLPISVLIVPYLARVVKPGPGSRSPPLWSTQLSSAAAASLPAPLSQLPLTESRQSPTDSPPLPPEPPSLFHLKPPTDPLCFSAHQAIRRRSLSLSSIHGRRVRMKKKGGGPSCFWWWSPGLTRSHLWSPGY